MSTRIEMQEVEDVARSIIGCDFTVSVYLGDSTLYLLESFDLHEDDSFSFLVPAYSSKDEISEICEGKIR